MTFLATRVGRPLLAGLVAAVAGCGSSLSISLNPLPTECFQEDVVDTNCETNERVITDCEEDIFGDLYCTDTLVVDEICEDVVVDTYLVCE